MAANPAGPAGTGKTECCKDFAKVLARYCIVFNCSSQNTVKIMEKLFMGQASTGTWSCLDEFNRIEVEVLSVIAQQMLQIREAQLANLSMVNFCGRNLVLNANMGIFITFNLGYVGRSQIPDSMQALMRPMAMVVPDYQLIAENVLYSVGFSQAPALAQKLFILFKLANDQVTMSMHYDFGMRQMKAVLDLSGDIKQKQPKENEIRILRTAIVEILIPRLLEDDIIIIETLITDLFPGILRGDIVEKSFLDAMNAVMAAKHITPSEKFVEKLCQLRKQCQIRFGVILLGTTMTAKTAILNLLVQSLILEQHNAGNAKFQVNMSTLNPKAFSLQELYGRFDDSN